MASPKVYVFLRIDYIAFASILVNLPARERPTTKSFAFGPPPYFTKGETGMIGFASGDWRLVSGIWRPASGN